ncbi:hypothetical protein [Natronococcus occultus]|uniref:Uncharacterized protein n=1 Tax=Natronococcus occultus SP4 TaxID=694430 RepID=L0K181_9EURY|nr:hypothetical protein [Natronococcus occultus]AGB39067.1 hypothetical protein Natoc_3332 [Natronococcus occultus SP4]
MVGEFTVDLRDGQSVSFDEIVVLERNNGKWIRCVRDGPSPRENLPETTKYYHLDIDVERIVIEPGETLQDSPTATAVDEVEATVIDARSLEDSSERRLLE